MNLKFQLNRAKQCSSVACIQDLRTGGCWFDLLLAQNSFQELMIVIATGFNPLSMLFVVSMMVMLETTQQLVASSFGPMVELPELEEQFWCVRLGFFCF